VANCNGEGKHSDSIDEIEEGEDGIGKDMSSGLATTSVHEA
jgi:hypothetical protein